MSDVAELVIRTRDGDTEAYAGIVRRFQDMAVGCGYWILHDFQLAQDAAQEAFLEAYLCLGDLREPAAFPGWFRRIVIKQCDRLIRGKKPSLTTLESTNDSFSVPADQIKSLEQRELRDQIWTAIDSLPEHERTAVLLFYMSGHSQREVSEFLGVPVTTVKKRLFSARNRLREVLFDLVTGTLREQRPSRDDTFSSSVVELLAAARKGDVERVEALLKTNRRLLTARDWLGNSALILAVNSGQLAVAELLFRAGVQPDIHEASAIGRTVRVECLLENNPGLLDSYSKEGFTPLALSAHFGHVDTVDYLLTQGADANVISRHPLQVTPLHAALFGRQLETARLLISRGADVTVPRGGAGWPRAGWTALHYVSSQGMTELIDPLIMAGADLDVLDDAGKSSLRVAIESDQPGAIELLCGKGARE